jgi:transposase-like protein
VRDIGIILDKKQEGKMSQKRYSTEKIIGILREAEVSLSRGEEVGQVCRSLGICEQTYYRWRNKYGGMKLTQARRLKELEKENGRLKRAVAELTLDKQILNEALEGNY